MAYTPQTWTDGSGATPLTAARLTAIENGIVQAISNAPSAGLPNSIAPTGNTPGLTISNAGTGTSLSVTSTDTVTGAQAGFFKTFAGSGTAHVHALTAYTTGSSNAFSSAANFVSDNTAASCVQVSGAETDRGTIKVTHTGQADGSDANASALSIDLQTAGTAAQGIFIDATGGATTGALLNIKNAGNQLLKLLQGVTGAFARLQFGNGGPVICHGTGSPEGVISAPPGSVYMNSSGGNPGAVYFKNAGTGNTGWVSK